MNFEEDFPNLKPGEVASIEWIQEHFIPKHKVKEAIINCTDYSDQHNTKAPELMCFLNDLERQLGLE